MAPGTQLRGGRVSQRAHITSRATPPGGVTTPFHWGERAIQRRAGVERAAAQVGRNVLSFVPGRVRRIPRPAAVRRGRQPGPRRPRLGSDRQILLAGMPAAGDPLEGALERRQAQIGVLAIELDTRQRIRLNGVAQRTSEGILLAVADAYALTEPYRRNPPVNNP
jgi:uncharacterized protein